MPKKKSEGEIVNPTTALAVSVTVSGPSIDEEKEFIYPSTIMSSSVTNSLEDELGIKFKPKSKKKIKEGIDKAKSEIANVQMGLTLEDGFYIKIKREPKKWIIFFPNSSVKIYVD
jgi:hypothetical protein